MGARSLLLPLLLSSTLLLSTRCRGDDSDSGDRVLFSTVTSLQFSATEFAASLRGRRRSALECVSGSASGFFWHPDWYPRVATCERYGSGADWRCGAKLRKFLALGATKVICERYGDDARYILADSCRLEYALNFTTYQARFVHVLYGASLATALFLLYALVRYRTMTAFNKF